ncbi:MAG TPA: DUF4159 domain-containing protein [Anaerolineaceae bacterium]|nr:DUF4159 domain-containing protein [Anaerolineaceae bacterium]HPN52368.1 DUF4159 domain-containing protein [Anaerolineaceae bacterium]
MKLDDLIKLFPIRRLKPVDGMAVTADTWEEAHAFHRHHQRFHMLSQHGWGIVSGLSVIASDPPDSSVFISPGVAVDAAGQTIVLPQPVAYDIGNDLEGLIYIYISFSESKPRSDNPNQSSAPHHVSTEFSISAKTTFSPQLVELARVRRSSRSEPITNAVDSRSASKNEINLLHRRELPVLKEASLAIAYLGKIKAKRWASAFQSLAQPDWLLTIDDDAAVAPGIENNTLVCLVSKGKFELNPGQINGLANYVRKGHGTLLMDCLDGDSFDAAKSIFTAAEFTFQNIPPRHPLLQSPYLFAVPPAGYQNGETLIADGIILTGSAPGLLWQGETAENPPTREQIRAAQEWGQNILQFALKRRGGQL